VSTVFQGIAEASSEELIILNCLDLDVTASLYQQRGVIALPSLWGSEVQGMHAKETETKPRRVVMAGPARVPRKGSCLSTDRLCSRSLAQSRGHGLGP
jgi:hypothetical protein